MSNTIYFSTTDGKLVDNYDIAKAVMIVSGDRIDFTDHDLIRNLAADCKGIKKEIENPSIKYLVKRGYKYQAVKVYHEKHPEVSIPECKELIDKIEAKLKEEKEKKNKDK